MQKHDRRSPERFPAFEGLSDEARAAFLPHSSPLSCEAGEPIIDYLDDDDGVYFLLKGRARVVIYSEVGRVVAFREVGPGDIIGELAAIDGQPRTASVEAVTNCELLTISAEQFHTVLESEPAFASYICRHLTRQIRKLTARVYEFSTLVVQNRIHVEILRLARKGIAVGNTARISPAPKHADIASRISTHREAVSRELSRMGKVGLLKRDGADLLVQDIRRLKKMVKDAKKE